MSAAELRSQIIDRLSSINDEVMLQEILQIVQGDASSQMHSMSEDERSAVQAALNDLKDGRIFSAEAAENMISEWRKK